MTNNANQTALDAQGRNRVIAGIREGGRWAVAQQREQFAASLQRRSFLSGNRDRRAHLASRLQQAGYVSASAAFADAVVGDFHADELQAFWQNEAVTGEYGTGVPKIRERINEHTARRPRQVYGTAQTAVTTPSKTAILNDLRHYKSASIDIPVVVQDAGGFPVETPFRVSQDKNGRWVAKPVAQELNSPTYQRAAEIIVATMEARRVRTALRGVDLDQAVVDRRAAEGTKPQYVASTFIQSVGFIDGANVATVSIAGKLYGYQSNRAVFEKMLDAKRPGQVYGYELKGGVRVSVTSCTSCGKHYVENGTAHTCIVAPANVTETSTEYENKRRRKGLLSLLNR